MSRFIYTPNALRKIDKSRERAMLAFDAEMRGCDKLKLQPDLLNAVSQLYARVPRFFVDSILGEMEPSAVTHLILGLGNFTYRGRRAAELVGRLITSTSKDGHCIRQDGRGVCDYHPWQSFAYSSLAGLLPDQEIGDSGLTLRRLAMNSRHIELPRSKHFDLGHLLIGASFLVPDQTNEFHLDREKLRFGRVVELALASHKSDGNRPRVCADFHLTEGLLLAVKLTPGLSHLEGEVRELLDRQLRVLSLVGSLLSKVVAKIAAADGTPKRSHKDEPCYDVYCDHCRDMPTWIGHGLELAALAQIYSYELSPAQQNTVTYVANAASRLFMQGLLNGDFAVIAHWRRALTLLLEIEQAREQNRPLSSVDLAAYRVSIVQEPMLFRFGPFILSLE